MIDAEELNSFEKTEISGQAVLPGFQEILDCEAAALKKPGHERFCVKFVETVGDSAKAWQSAIDPSCSRLQSQKNAHKLLKTGEIKRRIAEISAVMRNRSINEVIAFQRNALHFDPADYLDQERGNRIPLHKLPENKRRGIGLEARIVDGGIVYIPIFPSPQKAAESLSKMMGIEKHLVEHGGSIDENMNITVTFKGTGNAGA
jgi:hypothetical protein